MNQYTGKDHGIVGRLAWWSSHYGYIAVNKINSNIIREGIKILSEGKAIRGG